MTATNLTVDTVVPYLIARELVSARTVVEGDLEVIDAGRRNQNLKIVRRQGPGYLIKQPGEGERTTAATLRCEAWFYDLCQRAPYSATMQRLLPVRQGWDEDRGLLILELIDGRPLWAHYEATPAPDFPADAAAPLGEALGTLHRTFRAPDPAMAGLAMNPPWILFAHRPTPELYAASSPANLQWLKLLQRNRAVAAGLDELRKEWRAETLIHNDLKGDNVLVTGADGGIRVRIIDWELIQIGDPAWDVGAVLRDFLGYWLLSVPLSGDLEPRQMLERAEIPLARLHPAIRAFWQSYRAAAEIGSDPAEDILLRSLRYAAARLAQGSYELSVNQREASNLAIAMLQLAANILEDPREASLHLFGIPLRWRRPTHAAHGG